MPKLGEYAGVDVEEVVGRADAAVAAFVAAKAVLLASADADALLHALDGLADDLLPPALWPAQVHAIDAAGADPATRDERATQAVAALQPHLDAIEAVHGEPPCSKASWRRTTPSARSMRSTRLKRLFGRDFPVLPRFALGPYATEFAASLADQAALAVADPWRINGWLTQIARVRDGVDRFAGALSAHEALCEPLAPAI